MKKISLLMVAVIVSVLFFGCTSDSGEIMIKDGTYRVEYADFDAQGYKDYIEITFENGSVASIDADAVSELDGSLKSQSADYKDEMEQLCGTYPEKYYKDLINQYLENPTSDKIDIVAGATTASNSFVELLKALEKAVREGNTDTVIVKR